MPADDARRYIDEARQAGRLVCVCQDDLLAPYREKERKNHQDLCGVLGEHFGITLSLKEFCSKDAEDGDSLFYMRPLCCAQVKNQDRLLINATWFFSPELCRSYWEGIIDWA